MKKHEKFPLDTLILDISDDACQVDSEYYGYSGLSVKHKLKKTSCFRKLPVFYLKNNFHNSSQRIRSKDPERLSGFIKLKKDPKVENFGIDKIALADSVLQSTEWVLGMVLFLRKDCLRSRNNTGRLRPRRNQFRGMLNQYMLLFLAEIVLLALVR